MATKNSTSLPRVELLHVFVPAGLSGRLAKYGQHSFTHDTSAIESGDPAAEISLTTPLSAQSYSTTPMLPVFQTFLPEGFLKQRIQERFAGAARRRHGTVGLVRWQRDRPSAGEPGTHTTNDDAETAESEASPHAPLTKSRIGERATLHGHQLTVKVSGPDYPHLTENEFHCLSIARNVARSVDPVAPNFWLSADRKRLAIERFDYDRDSGIYSGFEDMVSLHGTVNEKKYEGSYENVAKAIALNAAPDQIQKSLREFFSMLVLSMVLRNGDAHLKNFGLLYTDPGADDCRLSPLYDLVCTTVYLKKDLPALTLAGARAWPDRKTLVEFGRFHCHMDDAATVIDQIVAAAMDYRPDDDASGMWQRMQEAIESGLSALVPEMIFGRGSHP